MCPWHAGRVIVIRLASEADLPALADLRRESTFELYPAREDDGFGERFAAWYERESSRRLTWLAEDKGLAANEGLAVGMMNFVLFERMPRPGPDPGRWGYLANAYVRPDYRNRGIGGRLLGAVLAYADDRGFARVVLSPSQRSIPFYRRAGFGPADSLLSRERSGS
jgi:GNAT superfamily N-acetyltransferase